MGAGDITYMKNETHTITVDTTYTLAGTAASPAFLISTSDTTNNPPLSIATGALVNSTTNGVDCNILGRCYIYGLEISLGGTTAAALSINAGATDDSVIKLDTCKLTLVSTNSASKINLGNTASSAINCTIITKDCTFTTGNNAGHGITVNANWKDTNSTFAITTTVPTNLFSSVFTGANVCLHGTDLSVITTTLLPGASNTYGNFVLSQCKLGSGVAILPAQTGPGHNEVWLFDCAFGDTHYEFGHYNYWGNTTISTAIYMSGADGASYNAADAKHSWKVTGVNGTYATPYVSPWIDVYNEGVGAVTPRLEILRDGSTTAYNDNQVWGEFSAKVTSGSTKATIVTDMKGLVASAAAQSNSALGASDWAGETTPWYGKLEPTSTITPAEIGHIRARVCVAGGITVYLNPKILGL
jgi:hypothetical protein